MKRKSLLFLLLLALLAPWAANGQNRATVTFLYEDFENDGDLPDSWTVDYSSPEWQCVTHGIGSSYTPSSAYDEDYCLGIYYNSSDCDWNRIYTPAMDLSICTSATLSFYLHKKTWGSDSDALTVYYRASSSDSWTQLQSYTSNISSWTQETISLPNLSSTYQIAFRADCCYGFGVYIDNVIVSGNVPNTTLTVNTTTGGTVTGSNNDCDPNYFYRITATPNSGYRFLYWKENNVVVNSDAITWVYMLYNHTYTAYFEPIYTNTATASPAADGTVAFGSYTYDFDDHTTQGWTNIDADGDYKIWEVYSTGTYQQYGGPGSGGGHNGSADCMTSGSFSNIFGALNPNNYFVSPLVQLGGSISFYARNANGTYPEKIAVAVSTSGNTSASDFTPISSSVVTLSGSGWTQYTVSLSGYSGPGYVAIRNYDTNDQFYLMLDDITIVPGSGTSVSGTFNSGQSCTATATATSPYSFLNWTESGSQLSTNATYTFTTSASHSLTANFGFPPATIPYTCDFETTSENERWAYTNGSYTNKWMIGTDTYTSSSHSLYISNNNSSNAYSTSSGSYVYAYREINVTQAGNYIVSFNWKAKGENGCYDAMYAALCPPSGTFPPTNIASNTNSLPSGYINVGDVSQSHDATGVFLWTYDDSGWKASTMSVSLSATGTYKLVFYWKNDTSGGGDPPAAVDDIDIHLASSYTLTYSTSPSASGTVTVTQNGNPVSSGSNQQEGAVLDITATPANGYFFTGWTVTGNGASVADPNSATTTFTMGSAAVTLTANFAQLYTVTVSNNPTAGGTSYIQTEKEIGVGGTATNSYLPAYTLFNNTLSEQIYTAAEIGSAGIINSIAFYNGGSEKSGNIKIYMVNTLKTSFESTTDWLPVTADDLVYESNSVTMHAGTWETFTLDTPFQYDDTYNLGLIVDWHMSYSSGMACRVYDGTSNCSMYVYSDGTDYNAVGATYTAKDRKAVKNQIKLGMEVTSVTVLGGTSVTLTAVPNTDYHFVDWTENNSQASTSNPYTFTVNGNHNLVANFAPNTHTLTASVNPASSGTISTNGTIISGATTYTHGTEVQLTATPNTGYDFIGWTVDGSSVGITNPTTVTMDQDHIVVANFELQRFTISASANPSAGGSVSGADTYNYNTSCTLSTTVNNGYTFTGWFENNSLVSTSTSYTFTVTAARTLEARFTQDTYSVIVSASPAAGGTVNGGGTFTYNASCTVTATANPGYTFGGWYEDNSLVSSNANYTFTVTAAHTLEARFGADHTLTTYVNPIEGGYVTIAENQVSTIGAVTVGSGTGHNNQSPFASNTQYSFVESLYLNSEMPGSCTITSLSFESTDGTAQSNEIEVYMMNVDKTSFTGRKDFVAMTTDVKVFDGTWTVSSAGWNTIILDTPFEYDSEKNLLIGIHEKSSGTVGSISFRMTENTTGSVLCWDNDNNDDMNPTDLNDLKASNHTQEKLNYRANVRLGFGTYHHGQSVTLTAHANHGYQFVNWTENSTEVGTHGDATYPVTMDADHTIYANFERLVKRFTTTGNWNVAGNWTPEGVPTATEDVVIVANATIPNGCVATANEITITTGSITIADGGQLQHNNSNASANDMITVTVENTIASYDDGASNNHNKGYEIVSFPVDNLTADNSAITGVFTAAPYDFYRFDASADPLEWRPMTSSSAISLLDGFIYASKFGTTIRVTGPVMSSASDYSSSAVTLNSNDPRFNGWALLGNPFVCNAYVSLGNGAGAGAEANFYKLNHTASYDEFIAFSSGDAVTPMGGVMFRVYADDNIVYSRTAPSGAKTGILNIDLRTMERDNSLLDRARVRFGEGRNLEKFQFDTRHTKVYIPEGNDDFSVYYAQGAGTIPVNFKAENNGRYTLDFSTEDVGFNYLHLIDNMNGNDVDLLQTPYYAFDAKSTDFASRFTLVFATGNDNDETFAFYNNGLWIINNDGEATLQVVDALGRILSSETISGSCSKAINAAPGVYMLRLINGNDVKVQKVVVRR